MLPEQASAERVLATDGPAMVHIAFYSDPQTALCGKALMGDFCAVDHPVDCIVCIEIDRELGEGD